MTQTQASSRDAHLICSYIVCVVCVNVLRTTTEGVSVDCLAKRLLIPLALLITICTRARVGGSRWKHILAAGCVLVSFHFCLSMSTSHFTSFHAPSTKLESCTKILLFVVAVCTLITTTLPIAFRTRDIHAKHREKILCGALLFLITITFAFATRATGQETDNMLQSALLPFDFDDVRDVETRQGVPT